jgi:hypothetical protein
MVVIYKAYIWYAELIEKLKPFITSKFNSGQIKNIKFDMSVFFGPLSVYSVWHSH